MPHGPEGAQRASEQPAPDPVAVRIPIEPQLRSNALHTPVARVAIEPHSARWPGRIRGAGALARIALGAALPVLLILATGGGALAQDLAPEPSSRPQVDRTLRPGDVVSDYGISVVVPDRGESVWGELKFRDGTYQTLMVETDAVGRVTLVSVGDEAAVDAAAVLLTGVAEASTSEPGNQMMPATDAAVATVGARRRRECTDTYRNLYRWRMRNLEWRLNARHAPKALLDKDGGASRIVAALKRAQHNVTDADNVCGYKDRVSARGRYLGQSRRTADVSGGGRCSKGDHRSVISFADLPYWSIAMTCVYQQRRGVAKEADILINDVDALWALSRDRCKGDRLLLEAAITHEFGHAYGLGHASAYYHRSLTMQPIIPFCSLGPASLGLGDIKGLERKY